MLWDSLQVANALGLKVGSEFAIRGISIDTRTLEKGDLYIALKGENFDGKRFAKDAMEKGAAGVVVESEIKDIARNQQFIVPDSFEALRKLATARRAASPAKIIGVTGSVGKTSVKDALKTVLSQQGKTHATTGNLNNHIGLPLTLARMPADTEYAVLEMGMNHAGEIAELTVMARPDVTIISTVEAVHIEFFGTVEKIAEAKAEIFLGQQKKAFAILPVDASTFPILLEKAKLKGLSVVTFGRSADADLRFMETKTVQGGQEVTAKIHGKEYHYTLGLNGVHQAINSLGMLAVVKAIGATMEKAMHDLTLLKPSSGRGQLHEVTVNGVRVSVLDDSYNASPASMRAAFSVLVNKAHRAGGRSIAVLGDMRELGDQAAGLHANLAESLIREQVNGVIACGEHMKLLYEKLPSSMRRGYAKDALSLKPLVEAMVKPNDILLIKGSHGSHMYKLAEVLISA